MIGWLIYLICGFAFNVGLEDYVERFDSRAIRILSRFAILVGYPVVVLIMLIVCLIRYMFA